MTPPFKIRVIAGYSGGASGVIQTMINELVQLKDVERVVFYDCLYLNLCGNTLEALDRVRLAAKRKPKVVAYQTSESGNSVTTAKQLAVLAHPDAKKTADFFPIQNLYLTDLSKAFQAVCVFRSIQGALADKVVTLPSRLRPAYDQMVLKTQFLLRGSVISDPSVWKSVKAQPVPPDLVPFADWCVGPNKKAAETFWRLMGTGSQTDSFRGVLWQNALPGWYMMKQPKTGRLVPVEVEDVHDLPLAEIGWEYLTL